MSKEIENRDPVQSDAPSGSTQSTVPLRSTTSQLYLANFPKDSLEYFESNDDPDQPSTAHGLDMQPPWEIGLDAWSALGYEDAIDVVSSVQYIDTSVGQKTKNHNESKFKDIPGLIQHVYEAVECTDSIGSISSCAEAGESVTSFTSVYEEIRNCEDDVGKISRLLELDHKASVHTITVTANNTRDTNSDSSAAGPSSKDSKNSKKKQTKILGSLQSKNSNSNTQKKSPNKQRQTKRSISPRHKIIVCDGKVGLVGFNELESVRDDKSPYSCDFFDAKHQPPKGKQYHEVFVTEKEYKLIQSVIPPPPKPNAQVITPEATECQRTLFGWVAFGSTPTPPPSPFTNSPGQIPLQFCRSRSKLGEFTTVSDSDLRHKSSCPTPRPKDSKGTQTVKKSVEFVDDDPLVEIKVGEAEVRGQGGEFGIQREEDRLLEGESKSENCFEEVVKNLVGSLQGALVLGGSTSSTSTAEALIEQEQKPKIDRKSLETIGRNMCSDVFAASETSVVLVNTVFKDIVLGSDVSVSLASSPKFQDFIKSSNEMDALEKAAEIYASAAQNIYEYLHSARNSQIPFKNSGAGAAHLNSSRNGTKVVIVGNKSPETKSTSGTSSPSISVDSNSIESESGGIKSPNSSIGSCAPVERQVSNLSNVWSFAPELHPEKFEMSLSSRPGILMETIDCNKWQFSISYTGGPDRINLLGTATREKAEPVFLNPQCLLEMVDRNASFASGRLTTSKYYMSRVSEKIGKLVQDFLTGKYARPTKKYTAHLITKFRSQNVFSGVLFQISVSFVSVCKRIQSSIEKAMKLDDALRCPRLPGLKLIFDENNPRDKDKDLNDLPTGAKMPMREAIQDLSLCMEEIDSILICGKNSLAALSAGVRVKKSYKNLIKLLCDAVKQLEFGHDVDFGTVIMSLACNAAVIQSLSDIVPTVDIEIRSRILSNLGHLNWGAGEVVKLSKRISLLSSFIASKSFDKLSKYNQIQAAKKKRKRQKKAAKDLEKENQERNGNRSMQRTLERIVEQRRLEEARRQEELREQLGIVD